MANDLHGAFAEWAATATGTKCQKYLYGIKGVRDRPDALEIKNTVDPRLKQADG
jgi:hypothetical protein